MNSKKVIVSVIIPCFNQGKFIAEAIQSVVQQTLVEWECIIVDDGSTDETEMNVRPFLSDKRVQYCFQPNQGVSSARNKGLQIATGAYIQLLDGDDIIENNKLSKQVDFLESNPAVDIVYGSSRYFVDGLFADTFILNENGNVPTLDVHFNDANQTTAIVSSNFTTICAPLYRRSIFSRTNMFKPIVFEDWLFHLECSLMGRIFHFERIDGTTAYVRINNNSQITRHKKQHARSPGVFIKARNELIETYQFSPRFKGKKPDGSTFTYALKQLCPPFIIEIYRYLRYNRH